MQYFVASILVSFGLHYVFYILVMGLLPGISANIVDRRPGRFASKTILLFNIAGMMPHFSSLVSSSNPNSVAQNLLGNPDVWLLVYGFACFGWVLIRIIPQIVMLYLAVRAEYTVKKLQQRQEDLVKEWGEVIIG